MKEKIYRISKLVLWVLLIVNFISFVAFTSKQQTSLVYNQVEIVIEEDPNQNTFLTPQSIEAELLDTLNLIAFMGNKISNYTPSTIERILKSNPYIKKAAVYTDIPGNLYIKITQKTPIGRVFTDRLDYYITKEGSKMPRCPTYTARVPIITGDFYEGMEYKDSMITEKGKEVYAFLSVIDTSNFYKAFCDQLFYSEDNPDLKMIPKLGNNVIIFGDVALLSDKLNKLRIFYSKVLNNGTLYKYKSINLKFKNQVVCEFFDTPALTDTPN
jgi:cell division protein FtsQ